MMSTFIILWLFLNCFLSKCIGSNSSLEKILDHDDLEEAASDQKFLIHGGAEVSPPHKYPFTVLVITYLEEGMSKEVKAEDVGICGGALLNELYVLSAAHCITTDDEGGQIDGENVQNVKIGVGVHDISRDFRKLSVEKIIHHPSYETDSDQDIMLIKLKEPLTFSSEVAPIALPEDDDVESVGTEVTIVGWGRSENENTVLLEANLEILSDKECSVSEYRMCAGGNGSSACFGDSGGPLFTKNDKNYVLVGVISAIASDDSKCGNAATIFTRVSYFKEWIEEIINS